MLFYRDGKVYDTKDCTVTAVTPSELRYIFSLGIPVYGIDKDLNPYDWRKGYINKLKTLGVNISYPLVSGVGRELMVDGNFGVIDFVSIVPEDVAYINKVSLKGSGVLRLSSLAKEYLTDTTTFVLDEGVSIDVCDNRLFGKFWGAYTILTYPLDIRHFFNLNKAPILCACHPEKSIHYLIHMLVYKGIKISDLSLIPSLEALLAPYTDYVVKKYKLVSAGAPHPYLSNPYNRDITDRLDTGRRIIHAIVESSYFDMSVSLRKTLNILDWFDISHPALQKSLAYLSQGL